MSSTSVSCNNGNDGTATASVSGGSAPYSYSWSGSAGTNPGAINLSAGVYSVVVTDASGCAQTATISVTQPTAVTVSLPPVSICNGQTASLTAAAAGGTAPYLYSWNGTAPQASSSFTISPTSSTTVTVMAIDQHGCLSTGVSALVTVSPALQVTATGNTACAGSNTTLSATASGGNGNYTYTWLPGNLQGASITTNALNNTIYTVTVADGCTVINATDTAMLTIQSVPSFTLPGTFTGCAPQCVTFSTPTNTTVTNWQWNFGDGSTSGSSNPLHCYSTAGNYNVGLTYTTSLGCVGATTHTAMVVVYPQPKASFYASAYETTVYEPQIVFTDNSTGNVNNWQWNFGDGGQSATQNPSHTYAGAGDYMVSLSVMNQYGCRDSVFVPVKVKEDFTFYAPNAFTPDGDNLNDKFLPLGVGWDVTTFTMLIFDRWGNQVFETSDPTEGWNGIKHGEVLQEDTYTWKVSLKDLYGGNHNYSGVVSIIR